MESGTESDRPGDTSMLTLASILAETLERAKVAGQQTESETVDRTLKGGTLILKGPESPCRGTSVR